MSVSEVGLGLQFLFGVLSPDPTLASYAPGGGYRSLAPDGTATPFWIVSLQNAGQDTLTQQGVRLLSQPLFLVKAVGPASAMQAIVNAASQIDLLLGGGQGLRNQSIANGFIAACFRTATHEQDELVNGVLWTNIGGLYRLVIEQIS
jgi:hypothetical protein